MPLLAPLLELVQLQELAPLAQAQLQVGGPHSRIPRLRFELLQAMVAASQRVPRLRIIGFAVAPAANVSGTQTHHISLCLSKLPCMVRKRKDEYDMLCVAYKLG